jgi:hypothetical protein
MEFQLVEHLHVMKFAHHGPLATFTVCLLTFGILMLFNLTLTDASQTRFFYVVSQCKTCEMGSTLARSDFDKGSYLLIHWGLPETVSTITGEILESDFGIQQIYGGCAGREEVDCYTNTMYSLLRERYGSEFYLGARDKALRLHAGLR